MKKFSLLAGLLFPILLNSCADPGEMPDESQAPTETDQFWSGGSFLSGVNYAWMNYGFDFGLPDGWGHHGVSNHQFRSLIQRDFAELQSKGVRVVRWYLLGDCRAAPDFSMDGLVSGLDRYFFKDVDAAIEIARAHEISLIFVILDQTAAKDAEMAGKVQLGGRAGLVNDHETKTSFIFHTLIPLFTRYADEETILAWEIFSDPEAVTHMSELEEDTGKPFSLEEMMAFIKEVVEVAHEHATQPVTVGNVSVDWRKAWAKCGIDYLQIAYPHVNPKGDIQPVDSGLPVVVSMIPEEPEGTSAEALLNGVHTAGYSGGLVWRFRSLDDNTKPGESPEEVMDWLGKPRLIQK
ncbi:MAG: hypothetical protein P1U68_08865 [Verrucomicrobiales bacterium]|nr:hypothetical protein [Verrucomicrobiales bacterium]